MCVQIGITPICSFDFRKHSCMIFYIRDMLLLSEKQEIFFIMQSLRRLVAYIVLIVINILIVSINGIGAGGQKIIYCSPNTDTPTIFFSNIYSFWRQSNDVKFFRYFRLTSFPIFPKRIVIVFNYRLNIRM